MYRPAGLQHAARRHGPSSLGGRVAFTQRSVFPGESPPAQRSAPVAAHSPRN